MSTVASSPGAGSIQADLQTPVPGLFPVGLGLVEQRTFRLDTSAYDQRVKWAFRTEIAQGREIVVPYLKDAVHVFRGLERFVEDEYGLDHGPDYIISSWKPKYDVAWVGGIDGTLEERKPVPNRVFVVITTPHADPKLIANAGWCVRWNWVDEDPILRGAPVDWRRRYTRKFWSKGPMSQPGVTS